MPEIVGRPRAPREGTSDENEATLSSSGQPWTAGRRVSSTGQPLVGHPRGKYY